MHSHLLSLFTCSVSVQGCCLLLGCSVGVEELRGERQMLREGSDAEATEAKKKIPAPWQMASLSHVHHFFSLTSQQTPVLPPTITDQIRLWELERDRLRFSEGEYVWKKDPVRK